ncbi:hypothetical protein CP533_2204 [Ophiocordyceps camponoti-saundersi (nom. inval.)]|nr:hypothetical protein CP533_2204 [Ophiocordyceps camponoti-saundersi (nom. inval.)]
MRAGLAWPACLPACLPALPCPPTRPAACLTNLYVLDIPHLKAAGLELLHLHPSSRLYLLPLLLLFSRLLVRFASLPTSLRLPRQWKADPADIQRLPSSTPPPSSPDRPPVSVLSLFVSRSSRREKPRPASSASTTPGFPPKRSHAPSLDGRIPSRYHLPERPIRRLLAVMGGCMSSSAEEAELKKQSQAIDKVIEEDSKRLRKECKILLLGSGESGKSTIVKQMKIIHLKGYSEDELFNYRSTVYKNLVDCAKAIITAMEQFDIKLQNPENQAHVDYLMEYQTESGPEAHIDPQVGIAVRSLWSDPAKEDLMAHQTEFYLMDSAEYFFQEAMRIVKPDYLPNEMDVLRARTKTTGIYETRFQMGQLSIHMFDVGGQRSERKKWIHCFENVTSIIFCVALSEYDQVLLEESSQNRMMESLLLFDSVVNSRWFMRTSIILFLNKVDIFKQKLVRSPLNNYFPDYSGGNDVNKAAKYLLWRFNQVNRAHLNLYPHLTQATDTSNIRLVFAAVKETILNNALKDSGIL